MSRPGDGLSYKVFEDLSGFLCRRLIGQIMVAFLHSVYEGVVAYNSATSSYKTGGVLDHAMSREQESSRVKEDKCNQTYQAGVTGERHR